VPGKFPDQRQIRSGGRGLPNSEAWGVDGWTVRDKESAFRQLREVVVSLNAAALFEQKKADRIEKSPT
jgi:autotransporter translocation and assembly factor TamB